MAMGKSFKDNIITDGESQVEAELDLLLQITENVWVQCENRNCQKWRKVPKGAEHLEPKTPWFCPMNPDTTANDCSKPEENHTQYEKTAKKAGIKFILSELEIGELVWAKTAGYCRWPGVITKDPDCGSHMGVDGDGDAIAYHVEYLGNPHTHCWVNTHQVETYGHKYTNSVDSGKMKLQCNITAKQKGKRKGSGTKYKPSGSHKTYWIEDAIDEAEGLLEMSRVDRLGLMIFEPQVSELTNFPSMNEVSKKVRTSKNSLTSKKSHSTKKKHRDSKQRNIHHGGHHGKTIPNKSDSPILCSEDFEELMECMEKHTAADQCVPVYEDLLSSTNFEAMLQDIEDDIRYASPPVEAKHRQENDRVLEDTESDVMNMEESLQDLLNEDGSELITL